MGESLLGKLKGLMARKTKSDLSDTLPVAGSPQGRIALATGQPVAAATSASQTSDLAGIAQAMQLTQAQQAASTGPIAVELHAEVPARTAAEEIVTISRRARDCVNATFADAGTGFRVTVVLSMLPEPQRIHTAESALDAWARKLGGKSAGWGIQQLQAA